MIQKKTVKERIQHPKTSKLKDPRLRRIRKNLRELLILVINDEIDRLSKLEDLYLNKLLKRKTFTASQWKRSEFLTHKAMELHRALYNSICICASGTCESTIDLARQGIQVPEHFTNLDMIYDPIFKKWYCEKCFYLLHPPT
jgi:hypothetical protein